MMASKAVHIETHEEIQVKYAKEIAQIAEENKKIEAEYQVSRVKLTHCAVEIREGNPGWLIRFPYNAYFLEEFKDCIPREAREWMPKTKSWWVDEECGQLLSELFDNWSFPIPPPKRITKNIKCQKCNDKGLVPSKALGVFSGKPIPNCYQSCECREERHDYYPRLKVTDFDFPMSYDFRSFIEEEITGKPLPPIDLPEGKEQEPQVVEHVHRHYDMSRQDFSKLQQTVLKVDYLEKRLNERKPGKRSPKYK